MMLMVVDGFDDGISCFWDFELSINYKLFILKYLLELLGRSQEWQLNNIDPANII